MNLIGVLWEFLKRMIDIHCHFVWGLDDGPSSIDDSLAMLRVAADDGITDIVATPHFNAQYPFQPDLLRSHVQELAGHTAGKPAIHYGCEFQLTSDNLGPLLENPFAFTINGGPYLLVELPNSHIAKHTESFLTRLVDARIVPVLVQSIEGSGVATWTVPSSVRHRAASSPCALSAARGDV